MAAKFQLALLIVSVCVSAGLARVALDNLASTAKIVFLSCKYPKVTTDEQAKGFVDCYDEAPGKEQFFTCQREVFGELFDTVPHIKSNCDQGVTVLPAYSRCINRELTAVGIDMNAAVRVLNNCQLKVFG